MVILIGNATYLFVGQKDERIGRYFASSFSAAFDCPHKEFSDEELTVGFRGCSAVIRAVRFPTTSRCMRALRDSARLGWAFLISFQVSASAAYTTDDVRIRHCDVRQCASGCRPTAASVNVADDCCFRRLLGAISPTSATFITVKFTRAAIVPAISRL